MSIFVILGSAFKFFNRRLDRKIDSVRADISREQQRIYAAPYHYPEHTRTNNNETQAIAYR